MGGDWKGGKRGTAGESSVGKRYEQVKYKRGRGVERWREGERTGVPPPLASAPIEPPVCTTRGTDHGGGVLTPENMQEGSEYVLIP